MRSAASAYSRRGLGAGGSPARPDRSARCLRRSASARHDAPSPGAARWAAWSRWPWPSATRIASPARCPLCGSVSRLARHAEHRARWRLRVSARCSRRIPTSASCSVDDDRANSRARAGGARCGMETRRRAARACCSRPRSRSCRRGPIAASPRAACRRLRRAGRTAAARPSRWVSSCRAPTRNGAPAASFMEHRRGLRRAAATLRPRAAGAALLSPGRARPGRGSCASDRRAAHRGRSAGGRLHARELRARGELPHAGADAADHRRWPHRAGNAWQPAPA